MTVKRNPRNLRDPIPPGYAIGRQPSQGGRAAPGIVRLSDYATRGYAQQVGAGGVSAGATGFGFSVGTNLADNEIVGFGQWPANMTFTTGDPKTYVNSEYPATAIAVFNIYKWVGPQPGTRTLEGTITFAAGSYIGVVAWTSSPYTHPVDTILELHAPSPPDLTLSWVTGVVNGVAS